MIVIRVELHSAITGKVTTLGKAVICNDGTGTRTRGNYTMALSGKDGKPMKHAQITNWPRLSKHVWALIARMLGEIYGK